MYCIYLKKKKGNPYCKLLKKEIPLSYCQECGKKEYKTKTISKLKRQTTKHKKLENKRFSIITNDLEHCIVCGKNKNALHEVFYGSYRLVSIRYGMVIPLCLKHHTMGLKSIHNDRQLDLYYKKLAQSIFIKRYSYDLFIKEFKIDYIEKYKEDN